MCKERGGSSTDQREKSSCDVGPEKALVNTVGSPGTNSAYGESCMELSYVCLIGEYRLLPERV